jgi:DNA-binding PadR family transcriptional regulator
MRTNDLRVTILKTFKDEEFYGYDIQKKLVSEGIRIEIGRLYKVLNQMLRDGLLESRWEKSTKGPKKKVYRLGMKGKRELDKILVDAIQTIHRAYGEYLLNLPQEKSVFNSISKEIIDKEVKGPFSLAIVANSSSPMYYRLLKSIKDRLVDLRIFIVKSNALSLKLELENIVNLEGDLNNIPLRDGYVDLLVTTSTPRNENIEKSVKEWCRVTKKTGKVALLAPTVLFASTRDPLTIGDYIEKWEHENYQNRKDGEGQALLKSLQKHFSNVKEKNIVHMKLILADNRL